MQTFSLKLHMSFLFNGKHITLENKLMDRRLVFKDDFGEPTILSENDFYKLYDKKTLVLAPDQPHIGKVPLIRNAPPDLTCFPEEHSQEAIRRRTYLTAIWGENNQLPPNKELKEQIEKIAISFSDKKRPPSCSTIRRWAGAFCSSQSITKLVPAHRNKGRHTMLRGEVEELLHDILNEEFLQLERQTITKVYQSLKNKIFSLNQQRLSSQKLALPSEMTVRRYIERLDPYIVDCKRFGKYAADKKHRDAIGQLQVEMILDRWEIDHTLLDVLLVDPETGEVIGRPYITVVLDRASRSIMAFLIHLSAPNTESVLRVIERAIRPKHAWLERFPSVHSEWRACGLPLLIMPDNAAEFHADNLIMAFNDLGIEILYPRSRGPQMKGAVERFFRTMNMGLIHTLPGTTFSNPTDRGDYPSEKFACLTLPEVEAMVMKWIVDVYHQTPHRGLNNATPAEAWTEGEAKRTPRLPADLDALESILACRVNPRLHHYGVEVDCQQYHSPELAELRMRIGQDARVDVRFRDDLGHVWVHDPVRNIFFQVPNKDKRMTGMSRDIYRAARAKIRAEKGNPNSFDAVHEAYRQILADAETAKKSNKLRKRRYSAQAKLDKEGQVRPALPAQEKPRHAADIPAFVPDSTQTALPIRPRAI